MKKRVYNIKGKRLVEGDINSITKEEMHVAIDDAGKVELSAINDNGDIEKVAGGGAAAEGADGMWMMVKGEKVFIDLSNVKDGDTVKVSGFNHLSVAEDITDEFEKVKYGFVFKQNEFENEFDTGNCNFGLAIQWESPTGNPTLFSIPVHVITPQAAHAIVLEVSDLIDNFDYEYAVASLTNYYSDEE